MPFEFDESRFEVLKGNESQLSPLSDLDISAALENPIDSPSLEEIVADAETVLIVVPDATRAAAAAQITNLLVRRLIAAGIQPFNIRIIFATGIHRAVTQEEKLKILGPFINQRIKTLDHGARDLMQIVRVGETKRGTPIELNRALLDHDRIITVSGINFHYFAGFSGGRKMICPGLGSSKTINETHKLVFDFENKKRREGVGIGLLDGNPVHEEFIEIAEKAPPAFSVQTIVDGEGRAVKVFAGHWNTAHREACELYAENYSIAVPEKRDCVVVSCGGAPYDTNVIQAHKALIMAANACKEGGTIVWLAQCADGMGRADMLEWFAAENSGALADKLKEKYQVYGQTAWSLLSMAERFRIVMITDLPEETTRQMRMHKARSLDEAMLSVSSVSTGYVVPQGAKFWLK